MNPKTLILFLAILLTIHVNAQYQLKDFEGYHAAKTNTYLLAAEMGSVTKTQSKENRDLFWFNIGLGGSNFGLASVLSFSYQHRENLFSLRQQSNSEIQLFFASDPNEVLKDIGLLYGIVRNGRKGFVSLSAGVAYVIAIKRGEKTSGGGWFSLSSKYKKEYDYTFGIPVELQVFATPYSFMGVGFYFFGNYNRIHSFHGVMLSLQFGRLK
jgi:hypothetical protein